MLGLVKKKKIKHDANETKEERLAVQKMKMSRRKALQRSISIVIQATYTGQIWRRCLCPGDSCSRRERNIRILLLFRSFISISKWERPLSGKEHIYIQFQELGFIFKIYILQYNKFSLSENLSLFPVHRFYFVLHPLTLPIRTGFLSVAVGNTCSHGDSDILCPEGIWPYSDKHPINTAAQSSNQGGGSSSRGAAVPDVSTTQNRLIRWIIFRVSVTTWQQSNPD